ncbi:GNAT family N-acetyltransferase [Aquibacillus saliphilus]|uniref:GNAT family N-acetyltransferase n=1 Tax=Aquibacillus saliphilus TaxID=1909422 RepID=UPI001CEFECD2|nr:GNAT family N-acetyltransferase [Aquibacillus saliphilus]
MYHIRKAVLEDADKIAEVHVQSWKTTYSDLINEEDLSNMTFENRKTLWETILQMPMKGQVALVLHDDDNDIVGFISGGKERTKRFGYDGEIYAVYLLKDYQRKGLGTILLDAFAKAMKKEGYESILVWILTQNPSSKFYIDFGAEQVDEEETSIGEGTYQETAFGWRRIDELITKFN